MLGGLDQLHSPLWVRMSRSVEERWDVPIVAKNDYQLRHILSACIAQLGCHWMDFPEVYIEEKGLLTAVEKIGVWLKSGTNDTSLLTKSCLRV